jgi:hypothetical protein
LRRLQEGEITEIKVVIDIEANTEHESNSEKDRDEMDEVYVTIKSCQKVDAMVSEQINSRTALFKKEFCDRRSRSKKRNRKGIRTKK